MMPPYSCCRARHEARHIDEGDDRNVEGIAETNETGGLDRGLDIQTAGQHQRLVGDDTDRVTIHAAKADDDVLGVIGLQLEEVIVVDDLDQINSFMSYGLLVLSGTSVSSE
jgi:hypothetical protein